MSNTTNKNIEKPAHNADVDSWDVPLNSNSDIIDACLGNVTTINLTGLSTYNLTNTDIQAAALKFTGTLASGVVTVKLTVGKSGNFTIIDATTPTDSTSTISMTWSSGGTALLIPQGSTLAANANGAANVWSQVAAKANKLVVTISLTGVTSNTYAMTPTQGAADIIVFTGTLGASQNVFLTAPVGFVGSYDVVNNFSDGGGGSHLGILASGSGVGGSFTAGVNARVAITDSTHAYLIVG